MAEKTTAPESPPQVPENVVSLVDDIIHRAFAARASDVHLEPGNNTLRVRFRVDALLEDVEQLPANIAHNIAARLKVLSSLLTYRTDIPQEGVIPLSAGDYPTEVRVATFPTVWGERVVLRLMGHAHQHLELDDLGHSPDTVERIRTGLKQPSGLIAAVGPAGSGKTTTLYAMIEHLRQERTGVSIFTVEDPAEIRVDGITQVQVAPDRGLTFPRALRSLLRQDPQVLVIGEIRDAETAQIAFEAAMAGHLLLTTMHAGSPAEALVRLREMGVQPWQLTSAVRGILSQRLVRVLRSESDAPESDTQREFAGRTAIGTFVEMTEELREALLQNADATHLAQTDTCSTQSLYDDARRHLDAGRTTEDEVKRVLGPDLEPSQARSLVEG